MRLSHPEHKSGYHIFTRDDQCFLTASYSCKMVDCPAKFAHVYGRIARAVIQTGDDVATFTLCSAMETKRLKDRAYYHDLWYVSLNLVDDTLRPTIAPSKLMKGSEQVDIGQVIQRQMYEGLTGSVRQINRPKSLKPESEWQHLATLKETDKAKIEGALSKLGIRAGIIPHYMQSRSPYSIAADLLEIMEQSPNSPFA